MPVVDIFFLRLSIGCFCWIFGQFLILILYTRVCMRQIVYLQWVSSKAIEFQTWNVNSFARKTLLHLIRFHFFLSYFTLFIFHTTSLILPPPPLCHHLRSTVKRSIKLKCWMLTLIKECSIFHYKCKHLGIWYARKTNDARDSILAAAAAAAGGGGCFFSKVNDDGIGSSRWWFFRDADSTALHE